MSNLQTITIASGSGDTGTQALTKLYQDLAKVAKLFADTSDPTSPADGTMWFRTDGGDGGTLYLEVNSVKTACVTGHLCKEALDFDGYEAKNMRAENLATGGLTAAAAGVKGQLEFDTTVEKLALIGTSVQWYLGAFAIDGSNYIRIPCRFSVTGIASNPATHPSTSTFLDDLWILDAAAETLYVFAEKPIPIGWTGANDLILEVECLLLNAETASDTIDLGLDWRSVGDAALYTKTATTATAASHNISTGNTQYHSHLVSITVDHDDATNTVAVDDRFMGVLSHDPTAGANPVAGVIIKDAWLKIPVFGAEDV